MDRISASLLGEPLRQFELPSTQNERLIGNDVVGRPLVMLFLLDVDAGDDRRMLSEFNALHEEFTARGIRVVGVAGQAIERLRGAADALQLRFPLLADRNFVLARMLGVFEQQVMDGRAVHTLVCATLFFDASLRVARAYVEFVIDGHARQVWDDAVAHLGRESPQEMIQHAPVLLIPNVLPAELCRKLIGLWEAENEESGFMREVDGKTVGATDYSHKIRRDHFMKAGAEEEAVKCYLGERVLPEIYKVFNYNVTRREDFRIACYDGGRGGYFRPHRDNTTGGTAHRRFAMSLLLNDDYEGGFLRFPEFGMHRYRPRAGGAAIFSCSLLHEATDVTAGRRFVLLSFLYGEVEAKQREAYSQKTGLAYRA